MRKARQNLIKWLILGGYYMVFLVLPANGQFLKLSDRDELPLSKWPVVIPCEIPDCNSEKDELVEELHSIGYVLVELMEIRQGDTLFINIKKGPLYTWGKLDLSELPSDLRGLFNARAFNPSGLDSLKEEVVKYYENRGYPFASARLDSITFTGRIIHGRISIDKGPPVNFAGIRDKDEKFRGKWLRRFTGINNELFDERKLKQVSKRLLLAGIITDSLQVNFVNNGAELVLNTHLEERNSFDGILGLQGDPTTGKLQAAGYVDLKLVNLFRAAQQLILNWERLRPESQVLRISYLSPALIGRTGLSGNFALTKMDSSYLDRVFDLFAVSGMGNNARVEWGYRFRGGSILERTSMPEGIEAASYTLHNIGLKFLRSREDHSVYSGIFSGIKNIDGTTLDPGGSLTSGSFWHTMIGFGADNIIPIGENWSWKNHLNGGWIFSEQIFQNDLILVGGLNSLRGFNERSLFTEKFFLAQNDLRLQIRPESYLLQFVDVAALDLPGGGSGIHLGWGAGLDLDLGSSGRLKFLLAWGGSTSQRVDWLDPKIHFGYVANF